MKNITIAILVVIILVLMGLYITASNKIDEAWNTNTIPNEEIPAPILKY